MANGVMTLFNGIKLGKSVIGGNVMTDSLNAVALYSWTQKRTCFPRGLGWPSSEIGTRWEQGMPLSS